MSKRSVVVGLLLMALGACAHKGAVRVGCDGVLRPINAPDTPPPVTIEPPLPKSNESQP
jgi:hypothetical protein